LYLRLSFKFNIFLFKIKIKRSKIDTNTLGIILKENSQLNIMRILAEGKSRIIKEGKTLKFYV